MGKSSSGRRRSGSEAVSRSERSRRTYEAESLDGRALSESIASSGRESGRRDDFRDAIQNAIPPASDTARSSQSTKSRSVEGSFVTALSAEPTEISEVPSDRSRADNKRSGDYEETRRGSRRDNKLDQSTVERSRGSLSGEESRRKSRRDNRPSQDGAHKGSRADSNLKDSTHDRGVDSASLPENQFPGAFPATYTRPYRPPGLATEYYGDQGESVASQPGVRPNPPSIVTNAEQSHLMQPSVEPRPPPEPSSVGQVGAAASYFDSSVVDSDIARPSASRPPQDGRPNSNKPSKYNDPNTSPRTSPRPGFHGPRPPTYAAHQSGASNASVASATTGAAAEYYSGLDPGTMASSAGITPVRPPPVSAAGLSGTPGFEAPLQGYPNAGMYAGAALAGTVAGASMAAHSHDEHSHSHYLHHADGSGAMSGGATPQTAPMQQAHRHKRRGPLGKLIDWFRDPEAVAQYEQYTEAIGVCKYCFDPWSSPADAPRKHHYRRRRPSSCSRYGSTSRVDKTARYSSDEERRRRASAKNVAVGGLAGYGAAKIGDAILKNQHDFDDTYSVKSGRPTEPTQFHFRDDNVDPGRRVRRYSSSEDVRKQKQRSHRTRHKRHDTSGKGKARRRDSSSSASWSDSTRRQSRSSAVNAGLAAAGVSIGAAALDKKLSDRRKHGIRSPSPRKTHFSKRVSPMHSYVELPTSTSDGLSSFFTSPSANKQKGKKSKGFFNLSNASSSSSDADLAYGSGTVRRKLARERRDVIRPKHENRDSMKDMLKLVAEGNALAAESDRQKGKGRETFGTNEASRWMGSGEDHYVGQDDGWYDINDDDDQSSSSVDLSLAYGEEIPEPQVRRPSRDQTAHPRTTHYMDGSRHSERGHGRTHYHNSPHYREERKSTRFGVSPTAAAIAAAGAAAIVSSAASLHDDSRRSAIRKSPPPLQTLDPRPISESSIQGLAQDPTGSIYPGNGIATEVPRISASSVPLQQPQPYVPVAPLIHDEQFGYDDHDIGRSDLRQQGHKSRRYGVQEQQRAYPVATHGTMRRRRDSSPAKFDLGRFAKNTGADRQAEEGHHDRDVPGDAKRRREGRRRKSADATLSMAAATDQSTGTAFHESTPSKDPSRDLDAGSPDSADARIAEIERDLSRLYEEQRLMKDRSDLQRTKRSSKGVDFSEPLLIGKHKARPLAQDGSQPQRKSSMKKTKDGDASSSRDSQQQRIARMAAQRVRSTPSPVHEDYGTFFVPKELKEHLEEHNARAEHRDDIGANVVEIVPGAEKPNRRHPFDPFTYRPFGLDLEDDPTLHPWPVPMLELIEPTPPSSKAHSIQEDIVEDFTADLTTERADNTELPGKSHSTESEALSGGGDAEFHDSRTPLDKGPAANSPPRTEDEDEGDIRFFGTAAPQNDTTYEEQPPRPDITRVWTLGGKEAEELERQLPVVDDQLELSPTWTIDDNEASQIEPEKVDGLEDKDSAGKPGPQATEASSGSPQEARDVATEPGSVCPVPSEGSDRGRAVYQSPFAETVSDLGVIHDQRHDESPTVARDPQRMVEQQPSDQEGIFEPSASESGLDRGIHGDGLAQLAASDDFNNSKGRHPQSDPETIAHPGPGQSQVSYGQEHFQKPTIIFRSDAERGNVDSIREPIESVVAEESPNPSSRLDASDDPPFQSANPVDADEENYAPSSTAFSTSGNDFTTPRNGDSAKFKPDERDDRGQDGVRERRKKRRSKNKESGNVAFADPNSTREKGRTSEPSERASISRTQSADDGFVSAKESPERSALPPEDGKPFLEDCPEMPPTTVMNSQMDINGVSGQRSTSKSSIHGAVQYEVSGEEEKSGKPSDSGRELIPDGEEDEDSKNDAAHTSSTFATPVSTRRLSMIKTSDDHSSPAIVSSPTAVPLHFRRPPLSPTNTRFAMSSPIASPGSPLTTPRTRQGRPKSTEFRSSKEFRPLYLVERQNYAKNMASPEAPEDYPSLPSSKTSSAHPSMEDLRAEAQAQEEFGYSTPSRINADMFRTTARRHSYSHWPDGEPRRESPDYLDSRSATPVPGEHQRAREREKKPSLKYEFHSPSELLQDPSSLQEMPAVDEEAGMGSPLPSVVSTETEQDYMSARSRSVSATRSRSLSRGRKAVSRSRSTSNSWRSALWTTAAASVGAIASAATHALRPTSPGDGKGESSDSPADTSASGLEGLEPSGAGSSDGKAISREDQGTGQPRPGSGVITETADVPVQDGSSPPSGLATTEQTITTQPAQASVEPHIPAETNASDLPTTADMVDSDDPTITLDESATDLKVASAPATRTIETERSEPSKDGAGAGTEVVMAEQNTASDDDSARVVSEPSVLPVAMKQSKKSKKGKKKGKKGNGPTLEKDLGNMTTSRDVADEEQTASAASIGTASPPPAEEARSEDLRPVEERLVLPAQLEQGEHHGEIDSYPAAESNDLKLADIEGATIGAEAAEPATLAADAMHDSDRKAPVATDSKMLEHSSPRKFSITDTSQRDAVVPEATSAEMTQLGDSMTCNVSSDGDSAIRGVAADSNLPETEPVAAQVDVTGEPVALEPTPADDDASGLAPFTTSMPEQGPADGQGPVEAVPGEPTLSGRSEDDSKGTEGAAEPPGEGTDTQPSTIIALSDSAEPEISSKPEAKEIAIHTEGESVLSNFEGVEADLNPLEQAFQAAVRARGLQDGASLEEAYQAFQPELNDLRETVGTPLTTIEEEKEVPMPAMETEAAMSAEEGVPARKMSKKEKRKQKKLSKTSGATYSPLDKVTTDQEPVLEAADNDEQPGGGEVAKRGLFDLDVSSNALGEFSDPPNPFGDDFELRRTEGEADTAVVHSEPADSSFAEAKGVEIEPPRDGEDRDGDDWLAGSASNKRAKKSKKDKKKAKRQPLYFDMSEPTGEGDTAATAKDMVAEDVGSSALMAVDEPLHEPEDTEQSKGAMQEQTESSSAQPDAAPRSGVEPSDDLWEMGSKKSKKSKKKRLAWAGESPLGAPAAEVLPAATSADAVSQLTSDTPSQPYEAESPRGATVSVLQATEDSASHERTVNPMDDHQKDPSPNDTRLGQPEEPELQDSGTANTSVIESSTKDQGGKDDKGGTNDAFDATESYTVTKSSKKKSKREKKKRVLGEEDEAMPDPNSKPPGCSPPSHERDQEYSTVRDPAPLDASQTSEQVDPTIVESDKQPDPTQETNLPEDKEMNTPEDIQQTTADVTATIDDAASLSNNRGQAILYPSDSTKAPQEIDPAEHPDTTVADVVQQPVDNAEQTAERQDPAEDETFFPMPTKKSKKDKKKKKKFTFDDFDATQEQEAGDTMVSTNEPASKRKTDEVHVSEDVPDPNVNAAMTEVGQVQVPGDDEEFNLNLKSKKSKKDKKKRRQRIDLFEDKSEDVLAPAEDTNLIAENETPSEVVSGVHTTSTEKPETLPGAVEEKAGLDSEDIHSLAASGPSSDNGLANSEFSTVRDMVTPSETVSGIPISTETESHDLPTRGEDIATFDPTTDQPVSPSSAVAIPNLALGDTGLESGAVEPEATEATEATSCDFSADHYSAPQQPTVPSSVPELQSSLASIDDNISDKARTEAPATEREAAETPLPESATTSPITTLPVQTELPSPQSHAAEPPGELAEVHPGSAQAPVPEPDAGEPPSSKLTPVLPPVSETSPEQFAIQSEASTVPLPESPIVETLATEPEPFEVPLPEPRADELAIEPLSTEVGLVEASLPESPAAGLPRIEPDPTAVHLPSSPDFGPSRTEPESAEAPLQKVPVTEPPTEPRASADPTVNVQPIDAPSSKSSVVEAHVLHEPAEPPTEPFTTKRQAAETPILEDTAIEPPNAKPEGVEVPLPESAAATSESGERNLADLPTAASDEGEQPVHAPSEIQPPAAEPVSADPPREEAPLEEDNHAASQDTNIVAEEEWGFTTKKSKKDKKKKRQSKLDQAMTDAVAQASDIRQIGEESKPVLAEAVPTEGPKDDMNLPVTGVAPSPVEEDNWNISSKKAKKDKKKKRRSELRTIDDMPTIQPTPTDQPTEEPSSIRAESALHGMEPKDTHTTPEDEARDLSEHQNQFSSGPALDPERADTNIEPALVLDDQQGDREPPLDIVEPSGQEKQRDLDKFDTPEMAPGQPATVEDEAKGEFARQLEDHDLKHEEARGGDAAQPTGGTPIGARLAETGAEEPDPWTLHETEPTNSTEDLVTARSAPQDTDASMLPDSKVYPVEDNAPREPFTPSGAVEGSEAENNQAWNLTSRKSKKAKKKKRQSLFDEGGFDSPPATTGNVENAGASSTDIGITPDPEPLPTPANENAPDPDIHQTSVEPNVDDEWAVSKKAKREKKEKKRQLTIDDSSAQPDERCATEKPPPDVDLGGKALEEAVTESSHETPRDIQDIQPEKLDESVLAQEEPKTDLEDVGQQPLSQDGGAEAVAATGVTNEGLTEMGTTNNEKQLAQDSELGPSISNEPVGTNVQAVDQEHSTEMSDKALTEAATGSCVVSYPVAPKDQRPEDNAGDTSLTSADQPTVTTTGLHGLESPVVSMDSSDSPRGKAARKKDKKAKKARRLFEFNGINAPPYQPDSTNPGDDKPDVQTSTSPNELSTGIKEPPPEADDMSDVSASTRERRKRRRSPPQWTGDEPEDLPSQRSTTPSREDDFINMALGVAAGLGFGKTENEASKETLHKPPSPVQQGRPGWSFANLAPVSDTARLDATRDSGVQFESPVMPVDPFAPIRDSGFIPSSADHGPSDADFIADMKTSGEPLRPPRPHSPTSSTEDVSKTPTDKGAFDNALNWETPRRKPSPVESTSKDRASALFDSSPALPPSSTKSRSRTPERPSTPLRRSPSIHGRHSREELRVKARTPQRSGNSDELASNLIDRANITEVNRSTFQMPGHDHTSAVSPSRNSLNTIREEPAEAFSSSRRHHPFAHPPASFRPQTPPDEDEIVGSGLLAAGIAGASLPASSRDLDAAKSLGGSKSRTSSVRNLRAASESVSPFDPVRATSRFSEPLVGDLGVENTASRERDMADVYDGYGSYPGSPKSPTRPPSLRQRRSMQQVKDLETKLEQLASENRTLAEAKLVAEQQLEQANFELNRSEHSTEELRRTSAQLHERDAEIARLKDELASLVVAHEALKHEHEQSLSSLRQEYEDVQRQWEESTTALEALRSRHAELSAGMESIVRHEIDTALADKNAEISRLREDLEAARDQIRELQAQVLENGADDVIVFHDEDYFDAACQKLCQQVQGWVLRFSKYSDLKRCRTTNEVRDEKVVDRFDNAILDGSDVDDDLADRVKRRDVFMSVVMTMIWEYVFTRYLFGMDREQRQKLKQLEKNLAEVGPTSAVHQWRALTLTLLSKRESFQAQRENDTEAVAIEIFNTLARFLPPPQNVEEQLLNSLRHVMHTAVELSIEMRTQRAEYIMLPPLQPEYDMNGDLARKVYFNASLMNERSGETTSNEELEQNQAVVRMVLFPLVVKKGDDRGQGDDEIVVCPAQVLVARPDKGKKGKGSTRVASGGSQTDRMSVDARSLRAISTHSLGAMSGLDGNDNMI
ncbi:Leashin [Exophiala dermatitidis]